MKNYHSWVKLRRTGGRETQLSLIINKHSAEQKKYESVLRKF